MPCAYLVNCDICVAKSSMPSNTPKTVLIVDDEVNFHTLFQELFHDTPYRVITQSNPKAALETLRNTPVDLVVTDQQMPEMTGAQLIREARQYKPNLVFILVSGQLDGKTSCDMIDAGIGGIFLKPVDTKAVLKFAHTLLERPQSGVMPASLSLFN